MFFRKLSFKSGLPLFAHRFSYRFEAYLIKGSSIFLKIDDSPVVVEKNSVTTLTKLFRNYFRHKNRNLDSLIVGIKKAEEKERLKGQTRLFSKKIDKSTLETLTKPMTQGSYLKEVIIPEKEAGKMDFLVREMKTQFKEFQSDATEQKVVAVILKNLVKESNVESIYRIPEREIDKSESLILNREDIRLIIDDSVRKITSEDSTINVNDLLFNLESRNAGIDVETVTRKLISHKIGEKSGHSKELLDFVLPTVGKNTDKYLVNEIKELIHKEPVWELGAENISEIFISEENYLEASSITKAFIENDFRYVEGTETPFFKNDLQQGLKSANITSVMEILKRIYMEKDGNNGIGTEMKETGLSKEKDNELGNEMKDFQLKRDNEYDISNLELVSWLYNRKFVSGLNDEEMRWVGTMGVRKEIQKIYREVNVSKSKIAKMDVVKETSYLKGNGHNGASLWDSLDFLVKIPFANYSVDSKNFSLASVTLRDGHKDDNEKYFDLISRKDFGKIDNGFYLSSQQVSGGDYNDFTNYLTNVSRKDMFIESGGEHSLKKVLTVGASMIQSAEFLSKERLWSISVKNDTWIKRSSDKDLDKLAFQFLEKSLDPKRIFKDDPRFITQNDIARISLDSNIFVRKSELVEFFKPTDFFVNKLINPNISLHTVRKDLSRIESGKIAKFDYDSSVQFLLLNKRWWFIRPTDPKTKINLPVIDFPYETRPVMGVDEHPIQEFAEEGMDDIEVSIEIVLELVNMVMHWWHHSYNEAFRGLGDETIQGLMSVLHGWYNLAESQEEIESKESDEEYKRVFRWIRWEAEKVYFDFKSDLANNQIYNGNHYMEILTKNLLDYVQFHHYMVVPLYDSLKKMDSMRAVLGDDPQGDIMKNLPDKVMGDRNYALDEENDQGLL
jgi:hypothetical protein